MNLSLPFVAEKCSKDDYLMTYSVVVLKGHRSRSESHNLKHPQWCSSSTGPTDLGIPMTYGSHKPRGATDLWVPDVTVFSSLPRLISPEILSVSVFRSWISCKKEGRERTRTPERETMSRCSCLKKGNNWASDTMAYLS